MLGCAIVLLLAHGFVVERYVITAATVMALLQAHLVAPMSGFAIGERLADTMLGAVLAWALSYVLPWLLWRLRVTVHDGVEAARAAASALARLAEREAATPKVH